VYEALKWLHVGAVIASGAGFVARAILMMSGSPLLQARFVRIAPHVVDTVLLAAGVAMALQARISPAAQPWLLAKIIALLAYIAFGAVALRYGRTWRQKQVALAAALATYAYIVGTALSRDPLWPLALHRPS